MSETIIEYVKSEMRTFQELPFNEVDSLVLSQFSYIHFGNLVQPPSAGAVRTPLTLQQLYRAECFPYYFDNQPDAERNRLLLDACAASPRFRGIGIAYYEEDFDAAAQKQFCAMTFFLTPDTSYLAFRGTDSTFVGWKEDFNMAFLTPVPSQESALAYTQTVARHVHGRLILGGHSKGGNLAVYTAMNCPRRLQNRILAIYSHDGPGFRDNIFTSEAYLRIQDRIKKTLPQSSLVGMLLEHQERYEIVESSAIGIVQHNPYSWIVRDGAFIKLERTSSSADYLNQTLADWLAGLDHEHREQFVDALYAIISTSDLSSFADLKNSGLSELPALLDTVKTLDEDTRKILNETMRSLVHVALKNLPAQAQKKAPVRHPIRKHTGKKKQLPKLTTD